MSTRPCQRHGHVPSDYSLDGSDAYSFHRGSGRFNRGTGGSYASESPYTKAVIRVSHVLRHQSCALGSFALVLRANHHVSPCELWLCSLVMRAYRDVSPCHFAVALDVATKVNLRRRSVASMGTNAAATQSVLGGVCHKLGRFG
jgi:hypothetical protein